MNSFEKLLLIIVPAVGLATILFFFTWYVDDNGNTPQTLQTNTHIRTAVTKFPIKKVHRNRGIKHDYIKWESEKSNTHESKSSNIQAYKTQQYKKPQQIINNYIDAETLYQQDLFRQKQEKQRYQNRLYSNRLRQQNKKPNAQKCKYYLQQKENIRDLMRRKYKAIEYNSLIKKQKYWAKLYADNCFSGTGYTYPR